MKKILLATDYSSASQYALEYAKWLAFRLKARLYAVHVYPRIIPEDHFSGKQLERLHHQQGEEELKKLIHFANAAPDQNPEELTAIGRIECHVRSGVPIDEVLRLSEELECGLIVVGTRIKHAWWEYLIGSFTRWLLERSDRPVLIIPQGVSYRNIRHIAFARDLSLDNTPIIQRLADLAEGLSADIHPFYVETDPREQDKFREERLRSGNEGFLEELTVIREKTVADGVSYFLSRHPSQMLVLYAPKRSFPDKWLRSSVSKELAYRAGIPVLVFKG